MKNLIKNKKGFTIIEVMIVLAVAGVIILIVLLAVPALQRSQRNTQRKNDVGALLSAATDYSSNNNGAVPTTVVWAAPNLTYGALTPSQAKLGYFSVVGNGQGNVNIAAGAQAALPATAAGDRVVIVTGASCGAAGVTVAGSSRQVVAQFELETGNGTYTATCQEG